LSNHLAPRDAAFFHAILGAGICFAVKIRADAVKETANAAQGARSLDRLPGLAANGGTVMGSQLSVTEVLTKLEGRVVFHREREAFHAQQEVHHREERARHAADLEAAQQSLERFRAAAAEAVDLAEKPVAPKPEPAVPTIPVASKESGRLMPSRMVRAVVAGFADGKPFGASAVAREVNRRFAGKLSRPLTGREASDTLRRMQSRGKIHVVQPGKGHQEALFAKGPRPAAAKPQPAAD
jgi:hypothetical protein